MASDTERPLIEVDGVEVSDKVYDFLVSIIVEQSVLVPDMFTLRIIDPDFELFDSAVFSIGKEVKVSYGDDDAFVAVTTCEITAIAVESSASGLQELVISGLDKAHRLARGSKLKIFEELTDSDIVAQIAGDYGLSTDLDSTTTVYPWLLQDQDDFAFITERALMNGYEWWVSGTKLYFKKAAKAGSSPELEWPESLISFNVRFTASDAVDEVQVRGWDSAGQVGFEGKSTVSAGSDELGTTATAGTTANSDGSTFASPTVVLTAPVADIAEAESLADSIARRALAEGVDARGTSVGSPLLKAGTEVDIKGLGDKLSGKYLLTSVDHVFRAGEIYLTRFRSGGRKEKSLVDLLGGQGAGRESPVGMGLLVGVVSDLTDPENQGRVKVTFPSLGDEAPSDWARLAALGAGPDRGLLVYPEMGDEVLVGFEDGNPRKPIILGGLWSQANAVPVDGETAIVDDTVETKGFYSRTGHKLEFSDGDAPEKKSVAIDLSDGETKFYMGEDKVSLEMPKPLTITGQDDITITSDAKGVTIEASSITLKSTGDIKLDATGELSLKGMTVAIEGQTSASIDAAKTDVKAKGMLSCEAGGIAKVKGSMLMLG